MSRLKNAEARLQREEAYSTRVAAAKYQQYSHAFVTFNRSAQVRGEREKYKRDNEALQRELAELRRTHNNAQSDRADRDAKLVKVTKFEATPSKF